MMIADIVFATMVIAGYFVQQSSKPMVGMVTGGEFTEWM